MPGERGYASELLSACLDHADRMLGLAEIRAFARPDNGGSRHVLEKAGFEQRRHVPEMDRFLFSRLRRPMGWRRSRSPWLTAASPAPCFCEHLHPIR